MNKSKSHSSYYPVENAARYLPLSSTLLSDHPALWKTFQKECKIGLSLHFLAVQAARTQSQWTLDISLPQNLLTEGENVSSRHGSQSATSPGLIGPEGSAGYGGGILQESPPSPSPGVPSFINVRLLLLTSLFLPFAQFISCQS